MKKPAATLFFALLMLFMSSCARHLKPDNSAEAGPLSTGDNSRVSLDWPGVYRGVLPCADCAGIETTVTLSENGRSLVLSRYTGKSGRVFSEEGSFVWDGEGRTISVSGKGSGLRRYLVGENMLVQLDSEGARITGPLAERYVLKKIASPEAILPDAALCETRWKLVELGGRPLKKSPGRQNEAHLVLEKAGGKIHGSGGCNRFFGSYELRPPDRIRFSGVGATMMACPDMEEESAFFRVLETADSYTIKGDTLQLNRARMAPLAKFEALYLK